MMKKLVIGIFILVGLAGYTIGQDRERTVSIADSILNIRGEVYFAFSFEKSSPQIVDFLSVKKVSDSKVFAYANAEGFKKFLKLNIDFQLQAENFLSGRLKSARLANADQVYPSYPRYLATMESFPRLYPSFCSITQIGTSINGKKLLALNISSGNPDQEKPSVLLTSSIHGNELVGFKLSLWLIEYLLENYQKDALVTRLLDETNIWIVPLLNPDGAYFGGDHTVVEATRFNANNLDLNRNFPDPAAGQQPDNEARQPETLAMMEFYKNEGIVLSAALHTGDEVINFPWDTWARPHADIGWYRQISRSYADSVHRKNSLYMNGFQNGIVNGYFWYRITGGQQDYVNYFLGGREITVELSETDMPDSVTLVRFWEYNREPLFRFLEQSLFGIRGKVTEKHTGSPLRAKIELEGHDLDQSWVYSDKPNGQYCRMLSPGEYLVQVSAPGYIPQKLEFTVLQQQQLTLDFELEPVSNGFTVYPNPFRDRFYVIVPSDLNPGQEIQISLTDVTGRVVFKDVIYSGDQGPVEIIPPMLPDGIYFLNLESGNVSDNYRLLKIK